MTLRDVKEVQRAHDVLGAIVLGEVPNPFEGERDETQLMAMMLAQLDVLCWVLRHDHKNGFPENLANLQEWLGKRGYVLEDHGN